MRSVEEHQRVVAELISARAAGTAALCDAEGLVLSDDVTATMSLPLFDNSAMDGYAVRADEVASATGEHPVKLPVAEDIPAGRIDTPPLRPGTVHRIMTGAPIPAGASAVVPVEATDGRTDTVTIFAPVGVGSYIRRRGEDVAAGTTVLRAGQVVTPAVVGLAAALGLPELTVIPRQRVLVMSTGSELVSPGAALRPGQIYESNSIALAAAVRDAGADVVATVTASDDVAQFEALLDRYAAEADLILTSGGVSAGAFEVVKDAFGRAGDRGVEFVKVAMQPGMPQGAGRVAGTPIVAVPGNPVSALVSFEVFIRPALRMAMGLPAPHRARRSAVLTEALTSPAGKRQFRRGIFDADTGTVVTHGPPGSHHLRWLASANCLLDIAADRTEIRPGSRVEIWDLRCSPYDDRVAGDLGPLSHIDERGAARMVDVTDKAVTGRTAVAAGSLRTTADVVALISAGGLAKGDALATARVAGILAAKRTSDLIPLCHQLALTGVDIDFTVGETAVDVTATVRSTDRTGVEMEALTAVTVAAMTLYDMIKAVDPAARIDDIRVLRKDGGRSGSWVR